MALIIIVGMAGTLAAFIVCRRAVYRTGEWRPFAAAYLVAAVALSGPLSAAWYETPGVAVLSAFAVAASAGLFHWYLWRHSDGADFSLLSFYLTEWSNLRWLLLIILFLYPLSGQVFIPAIGIGLLILARPGRGLPRPVRLPPLRQLLTPRPAPEGVIHYREWP